MALAALQILRITPYAAASVRLVNPIMVAQEAIGHFTRSFQKMRAPSDSCILNLPLEIILMVATHLDGCSLASLALTCKRLYGLWEPRNLPLQSADKEKLLLLLEKDIPFLYYCHFCTKLHRWHGRWSRSIAPWYEERLPCKRSRDKHLNILVLCHIPYFHARLVMNRNLYGSKHGLPVHALNQGTLFSGDLDGLLKSVSQHARIWNDQLLVLSVISMTHLRGDSLSLRNRIDSYGSPVCEHLTLAQRWPGSGYTQLPELAEKGNAPSQFLACGPAFGSCTFCPTDYSITILWQGARKGYKIEVLVYRGLGDCRTPFDWYWSTIRTRLSAEGLRLPYSPSHIPGSIRDQWDKAGGTAETMDGAWRRAVRW